MTEELKKQMQDDAEHKNCVMDWLNDSKMVRTGVVAATIAATLGLGKMAYGIAKDTNNKSTTEVLIKHNPETPLLIEDEPSKSVSSPENGEPTPQSEVVTEPEDDLDRAIREADEGYWRLLEQTVSDNGSGSKNHTSKSERRGSPEDNLRIAEELTTTGQMSMEETEELGYQLAQRAGYTREQYEKIKENIREQTETVQQIKAIRKANKDGKTSTAWAMAATVRDGGSQR